MRKLYEKTGLGFAILWIGAYCVLMSVGDSLSQSLGTEKSVTLPVAVALSAVILLFIKKNGLSEKYGLCRPRLKASSVLFYVPLLILLTVNLWHGVAFNLTAGETVLYILTMLLVGFLEEVIFRGLLFGAMKKDSLKAAVIVSSVTFGMGHIINLINGSGAEFLPNILQVIYATATGFMLVMLYLKTESLIVAVAFHGAFNALSVFSDESALTTVDRTAAAVFITAVSVAYGVYLCFVKDGVKKSDNLSCK